MESPSKEDIQVGDYVTYRNVGTVEHGRVKSIRDDSVFVVYNCAGNWGKYTDYTAALTPIENLEKGWIQ